MPLDPALQGLLDAMAEAAGPRLEEMTPAEARAMYESTQLPAPEPIELPSIVDRTIPGPAGEIPVRVYTPEGSGPHPGLVYFHGGGWVIGSPDSHDVSCRQLARDAGAVVVSVDYRLAPEHRYPAAADDCYAATQWTVANAAELGIDPARVAIGGDSAGGNLTAAVALMARDRGGPALVFQLLIYPVTDADFTRASYVDNAEGYFLTTSAMQWFWDHYVPDPAQRAEALCAPLRADDLSGLPPALVQTAEYDPLRDEGEAFADRLKQSGVPTTLTRYDGLIHGYFAMGAVAPRANEAVAEAVAALKAAYGA